MRHETHLRRGAVLSGLDRFWLLWDAQAPRPVCMPVVHQFEPLSRWDYIIPKGAAPGVNKRVVVRTAEARGYETDGWMVLTHLADAAIAEMERQIRRAAESEQAERRFTVSHRDVDVTYGGRFKIIQSAARGELSEVAPP